MVIKKCFFWLVCQLVFGMLLPQHAWSAKTAVRILIVEDSNMAIIILQKALQQEAASRGITIHVNTAKSLKTAKTLFGMRKYDGVILDRNFPNAPFIKAESDNFLNVLKCIGTQCPTSEMRPVIVANSSDPFTSFSKYLGDHALMVSENDFNKKPTRVSMGLFINDVLAKQAPSQTPPPVTRRRSSPQFERRGSSLRKGTNQEIMVNTLERSVSEMPQSFVMRRAPSSQPSVPLSVTSPTIKPVLQVVPTPNTLIRTGGFKSLILG